MREVDWEIDTVTGATEPKLIRATVDVVNDVIQMVYVDLGKPISIPGGFFTLPTEGYDQLELVGSIP